MAAEEYQDHQALIAELQAFRTPRELHAAASYQRHLPYLTGLFTTPRLFPSPHAQPHRRDFIRIAHWNIEKGKHLDAIIRTFREHPILREADLLSLNEADVGMNRSAQRFVARELGAALGMHTLFAPAYLEFTKGYGDDLRLPGANTIALQGNAILSRYELHQPRIIQLPICFEHFEHQEKRIGRRNAVAAEIEIKDRRLTVVSTHLEVRNDPACRARQMQALLAALEGQSAAIIAGDFNTNTTARGGGWRTLRAALRLSLANKERLLRAYAQPQSYEPLFAVLHAHGFTEQGFNNAAPTCRVVMRGFEDKTALPRPLANAFEQRLARFNYQLRFRLDWIVGRGVRPLQDGAVIDRSSGLVSLSPQRIAGLVNASGGQISDHDPITADIQC